MATEQRQPNFIVILTDDQGYNDLGCFGSPDIKTPCIDRMASEGMRLVDFQVQPVCGPSRAALMTGCYPQRIGQVGNTRIGRGGGHPLLHPNEITIAGVLKSAGYRTAMIGKWHLGMLTGSSPTQMGFDSFLGTPGSNDGPWLDLDQCAWADNARRDVEARPVPLFKDRKIVEHPMEQVGITTRYTKHALEFIAESASRPEPFFLYLAHNMPHIPLHPSDDFRGKSEYGPYGDCVEEIDWNTGRILDAVREAGIAEETLVIYTSDNGPWLLPHLVQERLAGRADPLRDGKVTTWEGGPRVPCVAWWPGSIAAGSESGDLVSSMDIFPTLVGLAGAEMPDDRVIDGKDARALLVGEPAAASPHETLYYYVCRNLQAVREGRWKLVLPRPALPELMAEFWAKHFAPIDSCELYNLNTDIGEEDNVAAEHPDIVAHLEELAERARADLGDGTRVGSGERFWESCPPCHAPLNDEPPAGPPAGRA